MCSCALSIVSALRYSSHHFTPHGVSQLVSEPDSLEVVLGSQALFGWWYVRSETPESHRMNHPRLNHLHPCGAPTQGCQPHENVYQCVCAENLRTHVISGGAGRGRRQQWTRERRVPCVGRVCFAVFWDAFMFGCGDAI